MKLIPKNRKNAHNRTLDVYRIAQIVNKSCKTNKIKPNSSSNQFSKSKQTNEHTHHTHTHSRIKVEKKWKRKKKLKNKTNVLFLHAYTIHYKHYELFIRLPCVFVFIFVSFISKIQKVRMVSCQRQFLTISKKKVKVSKIFVYVDFSIVFFFVEQR